MPDSAKVHLFTPYLQKLNHDFHLQDTFLHIRLLPPPLVAPIWTMTAPFP